SLARRHVLLLPLVALAGCSSNSVLRSERLSASAAQPRAFQVIYLQNYLSSDKNGNLSTANNQLIDVGYYAMGKQLEDHGPGFFRANGFDATVRVVTPSPGSVPFSAKQGASPLTLGFMGGTYTGHGPLVKS